MDRPAHEGRRGMPSLTSGPGRRHSAGVLASSGGTSMKHHHITGGGGVQLHVVETGNPQGRPILFLHGFSSCWLTWRRQLCSDLATAFRLIALDLRGHGLSEKPCDGYADSRLWADDINAVIEALRLDGPVLSGWSYGP